MALGLEILLWIGVATWVWLLVQGLINFALVPDISRGTLWEPATWPRVSIIVPARDEERLIRQAVTSFCTQDYPDYEVIVVDDRSTDATPRILAELQEQYANLRVVRGQDPPAGWLGKTNALQIGWREASGDWIVAVDADVVYRPDVLRRGLAYTLSKGTEMGVVHPRTETGGVFEAILMSEFNFFIFVVMPLFLVARTRSGLWATGSPVFNLVRRDAFERCNGFECIKGDVLDDAALGYRMKQAGHAIATAYAGAMITRRMYGGAREAIRGFTKIAFPTIRNAPWLLPLQYVAGAVLSLLPYYVFIRSALEGAMNVPALISLVLMHAAFAMLAARLRQPWYIAFAHPIRELIWWWIFARSFIVYCRKGIVWRNRTYTALE